jgi:hypothetical protein
MSTAISTEIMLGPPQKISPFSPSARLAQGQGRSPETEADLAVLRGCVIQVTAGSTERA